jgi:hypothetical protein
MMTSEEFARASYDQFRIQAKGSFLVKCIVRSRWAVEARCRDILYEALSIPLPTDSAQHITWPSLPFSLQEYETREEATNAAIMQIYAWDALINRAFVNHSLGTWTIWFKISAQFEGNVREWYNAQEWNLTISTSSRNYPSLAPIFPNLLENFEEYLVQFVEPDYELPISSGLNYNIALREHIRVEDRRNQLRAFLQNSGLCVKQNKPN